MEYYVLNNGLKIPAIGSGSNTFGRDDEDLKSIPTGNFTPLYQAIENGYTFFDCAKSYGNEAGMGDAFVKSGVKRENLFLLSKIPNKPEYFESEAAIRACAQSTLDDLHTEYLDMYLIHQPISYADQALGKSMDKDQIVFVYKVLEKMYKEGIFKSIGVANFTPEQLDILMNETEIVPAANQFRSNPAVRNVETVEYCQKHSILPMAHSPMNFTVAAFNTANNIGAEYRALAGKIGEKYGKGWGQVLLRYDYQKGICAIPKTHFPQFQQQNIDIFDFALTDEEMAQLY